MAKYIGNDPSFTINGIAPSADGTFTLTSAELDVAEDVHQHAVADIVGLQDIVDNKSDVTHVHDYVQSITANGQTAVGDIVLEVQGDLAASAAGNIVSLTALAPTTSVTNAVIDESDGTTEVRTFVGTQAEWDAFTPDPAVKYLIYIHA